MGEGGMNRESNVDIKHAFFNQCSHMGPISYFLRRFPLVEYILIYHLFSDGVV